MPDTLARAAALGHAVFTNDSKPLNLNLIGIRSPSREAGKFDDALEVWWKFAGVWHCRRYVITTDPGTYYLAHPMRVEGTAILCAGQYRGAWEIGKHKGYPALRQVKPVKVWRDGDKDAQLDWDVADESKDGLYGINIHASDLDPFDNSDRDRAGGDVGRWSAGCQVFASSAAYRDFWKLVTDAAAHWGTRFTYTLIED